jgi:hypothetical protein
MDVFALKNHIIDDPDYIELLLEKTGFHDISERDEEYRCAWKEGRNPTSVKVNKQTLSSTCFSMNINGDIITLIQSKLNTSFTKAIKRICEIVDFKYESKIESFTLPFGGFYKKIAQLKSDDALDLETYSEDILMRYERIPNLLFYEDGILPHVQDSYGIGYDADTGRITVPWYSENGLVGIMGRLNKREVSEEENKWFPILPFPKSKVLYGFMNNYKTIQEKGFVMVGESEKSSLQFASKGLDVGVSLGGTSLSEHQANNIKGLFCKRTLVLLDEGIPEDQIRDIASKLKLPKLFKSEVGYVFDKENRFLPKGSKIAPSDLDKKKLNELIKSCTVWI